MLTAALSCVLTVLALAVAPSAARAGSPGQGDAPGGAPGPAAHTVTFDKYSLMLDGKRTYIWSGEFHYFRLPSPDLWRDVLQKMKAEGYNAVSMYFDWGYHSPAPGVYDFSGVRDVDKLLDIAQQVGLYVIARPGPYINAEVDGGGLPGWLTNVAGKARTDDPDYVAAADEWLTHIDAILARHQYTDGTGPVILYQIENELAATGTTQKQYMQHLYDKVRADGITVPIFHNDKGRHGIWVPSGSDVPGTVTGPTDLYAFDGYPGGSCHTDATVGSPSTAPDWGIWGSGGASGGSSASPNTPGFTAEFGGGWFDYWGSQGTYDCTAQREGSGYERVFYGTNIANRLDIQNVYMGFGGTSWGWLPAPVVYSSYDYGAGISEARQLRPKVTTMKELGLFVQSVTPLTKIDPAQMVTPSNSNIKIYDDVNPDTGTHFYIAMHDPSNGTGNDLFTFGLSTADGSYTVPQQGTLRIDGQDSKILTADYDLDAAAGSASPHLVYSTSQIMTHLNVAGGQLALLYGPSGEDGETVLRYADRPQVQVLAGSVSDTYDTTTGDLRLNYVHDGLAEVRITGGGRDPLTLLLADTATAGTFWEPDTDNGPVLVRGPELVRTAAMRGVNLLLTGDTKDAADLQVWGPERVHHVEWNGRHVRLARSDADGSFSATRQLPGAEPITLPDLTGLTWKTQYGSPESQPGFDDSKWLIADKTTTASTTPPPSGQPVLTADDYGFHTGDVWYRAHYTGAGAAGSISLRYGGGGAGLLQAWLDGVYLGQNVLASGQSSPATTGSASFTIPQHLRTDGAHVLSVMVRNDGHNEDGGVNDAQKEGRGLISMTMADPDENAVAPGVTWRIQGDEGGEDIVDTARGVMNASGSYGDRHGWYLPGFPTQDWKTATVPASSAVPGTSWYTTSFRLDILTVDDASLGLTIGDPSSPQSSANYRALIYVNGWNVGQYIANVGPQHTFVVPNGILNPNGDNSLAIEVTSNGGAGNGLEKVQLTDLGTVRGGVAVAQNQAPDWSSRDWGEPQPQSVVAVDPPTFTGVDQLSGGDTFTVSSTIRNDGGPEVTDLQPTLDLPSGWTSAITKQAPDVLAPGAAADVSWTVTLPDDAAGGTYAVAVEAGYRQAGQQQTTGASGEVSVRQHGLQYVSDMPWVSSTNGWGPVERDESVGGTGQGDGGPLDIAGTTYAKGLGTNSPSTVVLDLGGTCSAFSSDVGLDIGAGSKGSVTFTVIGDGTVLAQTGTMRGGDAPQHLDADLTGVQTLTLEVGDAGDGNGHDNADWGGAQVICA
ncbi:MAG TPA: beta-galactosidase [Jatrophihabitantaceae bacterium]|nr:beta-galactosidase [Jatrophihabitantaceae bacterium]